MATRMRDLAVPGFRRELQAFKPHDILIDPGHNPREWNWNNLTDEQKDSMAGLQASILQNGVERPILIRRPKGTDEVWLVDGERRLRAARMLVDAGAQHIEGGWQGVVPVMLVTPEGEGDCLLQALRANDGEPLTKMELGRAYKKLLSSEWSYTKERIALETGVKQRYITEALALAEMPAEVQGMVERGEVAPAAALHQVKVSEGHAAEVLREKVDQAKAEGKTILKREKVPAKSKEAPKAAPRPEHSRAAQPLRCPVCHNEVERLETSPKTGRMTCAPCIKVEHLAPGQSEEEYQRQQENDRKAKTAGWPEKTNLERRACILKDLIEAADCILDEADTEMSRDKWDDTEESEPMTISIGNLVELRDAVAGWKAEATGE